MASRGSGRGLVLKNLFAKTEDDAASGPDSQSKADSGVGSLSGSRVGRGQLLQNIRTQFEGMSTDRARLIESSNQTRKLDSHTIERPTVSRGRAQLIQQILTSASLSSDNTSTSSIQETTSNINTMQSSSMQTENVETKLQKSTNFCKSKENYGTKGTKMTVACNYIKLETEPDKGFFMYEVLYKPTIDSSKLRMKYLNEHKDKFGRIKLFDGVILYLPICLPEKCTKYHSKCIAGTGDIEISVIYKRQEEFKNSMHIYNILFDRIMKTLNFVRFNRKQFDPTAPKIIPQAKLEIWPGYVTAVDEYDGGIMLCCDVSHRLLCQKTVLEILVEIYHSSVTNFRDMAKKSLLGSVVITRYNNRTYRIDDICFEKNPLSTFELHGEPISYVDYYRRNYNIEIKDHYQPLLLSIKKQRGRDEKNSDDMIFCIIPEICHLTGLRDELRSDCRLMREIATFTRVSPNQRMAALEKFYNNIENNAEARQILLDWGLSLKSSYENIVARQLEEQHILFAKNQFLVGPQANFSQQAINNELIHVVHLENWLILHCKMDIDIVNTFTDNMRRITGPMGIRVKPPKIIMLPNDRVDSFVSGLRSNINRDVQIVVCICPTNRDDRYAAIKKICCAEIPIPSQVIIARTLKDKTKSRSIVQKIALQMNCKLGGSLWAVRIPFKNVMICGVDAYHDSKQIGNSVYAFVASTNSSYTNWYSKCVIQKKKEEIMNALCVSLVESLLAYQKENDKLPDSVIIYRDGVGDGQLNICLNYELPQLEAACAQKFLNFPLKITYIIVQKRINTRYLVKNSHSYDNPKPGTIVDHTITRKALYDFFLVSQSVRQGTVTPTHYIILRDDAEYTPDILQRLTYKLCFLYYNWPGTIRIPACCLYAHKLAYLVGQSICKPTSDQLADKLFYL